MRKLVGLVVLMLFPIEVFTQTPGAPAATNPGDTPQMFWYVFWIITLFLVAVLQVTLLALLRSKEWSFGDAISEEAAVQPTPPPPRPVMVASSSRLIAFLGLIVILSIYIGVGYYVVWQLFTTGVAPDLSKLTSFLYGGAVIFAPYLVNQLKEAFAAFAPK